MDNQTIKNIEVGKFYIIHDGSDGGHPGLVIWKDDLNNLYLLIKFGTTQNDKNTPIEHPLSKNVSKHYVYKRAVLAKRKDVGREWMFDYEINDEDKSIVENVTIEQPVFSKSINRKDKRFYSLAIKLGKIKTAI